MFTPQRIHHFIQFVALLFHPAFISFLPVLIILIFLADGAANFTSDGYWDNLAVNYPGAMISFILTPKGPCIDGSAAPTKQIDCSVEDLQQGRYLVDFPYAYYRLTAVLRTAQGDKNNYG